MDIYSFSSYFQVFSTITIIYGGTDYLRESLFAALRSRIQNDLKYYIAQNKVVQYEMEENDSKKEDAIALKRTNKILDKEKIKIENKIESNKNLLNLFTFSYLITSLFCLSLLVVGGLQLENFCNKPSLNIFSVSIATLTAISVFINFIYYLINGKCTENRLKSIIWELLIYLMFIFISYILSNRVEIFSTYGYFTNKIWIHILLLITPILVYLLSGISLLRFGRAISNEIEDIKKSAKLITEDLTEKNDLSTSNR